MNKMNKPELTDEMIDDACKCLNCIKCTLKKASRDSYESCVRVLAQALKAEKAKEKVWTGAPDNATDVNVIFFTEDNVHLKTSTMKYTRDLPKTKARLIAEKIYNVRMSADFSKGVEQIEAILEAQGDGK